MRAKKISSMLLVAVIVFLACIAALFGGVRVARAESPVTGTDGRYNVSYTLGGRTGIGGDMTPGYMAGPVVVER